MNFVHHCMGEKKAKYEMHTLKCTTDDVFPLLQVSPRSVSSSQQPRRSLRLLGFDSGGGAGARSRGSVWTTACHCSG